MVTKLLDSHENAEHDIVEELAQVMADYILAIFVIMGVVMMPKNLILEPIFGSHLLFFVHLDNFILCLSYEIFLALLVLIFDAFSYNSIQKFTFESKNKLKYLHHGFFDLDLILNAGFDLIEGLLNQVSGFLREPHRIRPVILG